MIVFSLACAKGHGFEAWFRNGADFERQSAAGAVRCPACGSAEVEKALMAPAVPSATREGAEPSRPVAASPPAAEAPVALAAPDPRRRELLEALRRLRQEVTANAVDVGDRFAEEARKIHYEEVEPRGIYGQATLEEAKGLADEGIAFHPLPLLPEDRN